MAYYLTGGVWHNVFAVPSIVVDRHIKLCGAAALKVLLIALRHPDNAIEPEDIADRMGLPLPDIQDALSYWVDAGIFLPEPGLAPQAMKEPAPVLQYEVIEQPAVPEAEPRQMEKPAINASPDREKAAPTDPEPRILKISQSRPRLTRAEINEMADQDNTIPQLLQEAQTVLGKPLTPVSTDVIVSLYSYYGMAPDIILLLLHYCVTSKKDRMSYVEAVASSWLSQGIDSYEKAERFIEQSIRRKEQNNLVRSAFGIYDRNLISNEEKFILKWFDSFGFGIDMIKLAYERTIENIGKLSFPYINKILADWHDKGIKTPEQASKEMRVKEERAPGIRASSYNIDKLEQLTNNGRILD